MEFKTAEARSVDEAGATIIGRFELKIIKLPASRFPVGKLRLFIKFIFRLSRSALSTISSA
jgi:hypothetical protein